MRKESYSTEPTALDPLVFEKLVPPDHALRRVKQCFRFVSVKFLPHVTSAVKITPVGNQLAARQSLLRGSLQGNLIAQEKEKGSGLAL